MYRDLEICTLVGGDGPCGDENIKNNRLEIKDLNLKVTKSFQNRIAWSLIFARRHLPASVDVRKSLEVGVFRDPSSILSRISSSFLYSQINTAVLVLQNWLPRDFYQHDTYLTVSSDVALRRVIQIIRLLLKLCCSLAGWRARNETKSIIFPARFSAVKRWIRQSSFIFKIRDVFEVINRKVKGKKGEEIIH